MIVGALDRSDRDHPACSALLSGTREARIIPAPVLVEVDHFLTRYIGPEAFAAVLADVERGAYDVEDLKPADYVRAGELLDRYADMRIGFVDCAVLAIVERLGESKLATLDQRHFGAVRPAHRKALTLLP